MWSPSKTAALRAARRRSSIHPTFDLMPFVGVFLVLLFIFMLTPPSHGGGLGVTLPMAKTSTPQRAAIRDDAISISVTGDGRCYLRFTHVAPPDLPNLIRAALREGSERKVYLSADTRARNKDVGIVVDQIRLAGIANLAIMANKSFTP
jgi:biopolymer transport protein TolR